MIDMVLVGLIYVLSLFGWICQAISTHTTLVTNWVRWLATERC